MALLLGMFLLSNLAWSQDLRKMEEEYSHDGLVLKTSKKYQLVYIKEGVDWSQYKNMQVLDCHVAFKKNWQRDLNRSGMGGRVTDKDVLRIKTAIAEMFKETMSKAVEESGVGLVAEPQENTLQIRPSIINLDVTAPDTLSRPARDKTYVRSAGSATLYLDVYDSVSGEILARVLDYSEAPDRGYLEWANRATNSREARIIIKRWATDLMKGFEKVQAESKAEKETVEEE